MTNNDEADDDGEILLRLNRRLFALLIFRFFRCYPLLNCSLKLQQVLVTPHLIQQKRLSKLIQAHKKNPKSLSSAYSFLPSSI